uniref:Stress responsive A/B Barrel Domain n=1 Tax=Candidatus Kentrum sp. DK TaxID=2126562 RepID=A0A450SXG2_9GAMM|nr:MAG: Stress responsive A/B Barrel Domain [Candidatus Kentron sp. DK]VFJ58740.1 MAG: Stress responsive A/B Barrel Domain [Candidatus Kentron sp. DK]
MEGRAPGIRISSRIRGIVLLIGALSLFGCAALSPSQTQRQASGGAGSDSAEEAVRSPGAAPSEIAAVGRVNHVVLVWLKESGNPSHRRKIIAASRNLREIPGVLGVRAGEVVPSRRGIVDDSFDVGISITFASVRGMTEYIHHPRHARAVREVFRPLAARILIYDFVE